MAYEISLTRLLSALLAGTWVAPVLAAALLGTGLGAGVAALWPAMRTAPAARTAAGLAAVLGCLSLPAWLWAVATEVPLLGLAVPVLTYVALGVAGAALLSWWPQRAAWLLRADFGAAALAALATPWLLGQWGLGAIGGVVIAMALVALAALVLRAADSVVPLGAATAGAAAVVMTAVTAVLGVLAVEPAVHMTAKPITTALRAGGVVTQTRWDATARTDEVLMPNGARYLYMDGGAGSLVATPNPNDWSRDVGGFAYAMAPAESAFMIGTGGGLDVAQARLYGVETVVAVEVNPASVELVRDKGADAGGVYDEPTQVVIGEGRRVLASGSERYDLITLANVVTGAAELRGAALTENTVYTVEAFGEYLQHLTPDGRVALKLYDELTLTRTLTTAVTALVEYGHAADEAAAVGHLFAVLQASGGQTVPLLVVRRSAFTRDEAVEAARVAETHGWSLLLVPGLLAPAAVQAVADGTASIEDLSGAGTGVDLSPTYDVEPYFFSFEPGAPRTARLAGVAAVIVAAALVLIAFVVGARASGEMRHDGTERTLARSRRIRGARTRGLLTAAALGAGFLLVELAALPLVQRSAGHPAWSLSLMLGAVLAGSAVGAWIAARSTSTDVKVPALVAALTVLLWNVASPALADAMSGLPALLSGTLLAVTLALCAMPLGMPFPRLLAALERPGLVATALALSGSAAVAAGAGSTWLAHTVGVPAVAWAAAGAYLVAALVVPNWSAAERGAAEGLRVQDPSAINHR